MERPRIVIIDSNFQYIIPLQAKFVEEYFETIDLEVITEAQYYSELFQTPQSIDVLVVEEELYSEELKKHNIKNVFVMTEKKQLENEDAGNVKYLYKYTSVKSIFNEITGSSRLSASSQTESEKGCQIVLVYSGIGGAGKTTLALGISKALTDNYKKVLYIDASRVNTFGEYIENQKPITDPLVYAKLAHAGENPYEGVRGWIRKEDFYYLAPFKAALMSFGIPYSIYEKLAVSAKNSGDFDFIVVDADCAFDEDKAKLISVADRVLVVTEQTKHAAYVTNELVSNINGVSSKKYMFVCNKFDSKKENIFVTAEIPLKFSADEYIEYLDNIEKQSVREFANSGGIQKIAFLLF